MTDEYDLKQSAKSIGKLYPILKDAHGNIIDGFHREIADPEWPVIKIESVTTPKELELARLVANFCRRGIPATETDTRIAFLIEKCGMKPEEIAIQTGISVATIYRHMPQEMKNEKLSEAQKAGHEAKKEFLTCETNREIPETKPDLLVCEYCGVATSDCKPWNGHILCEKHFNRPEIDGYFRTKEREAAIASKEQKPLNRTTDSWLNREARMHPQHSKIELDVLTLLEQEPELRPVAVDRGFPLVTTIPDFLFTKLNLAVYLDGPVHEGKEDRDEKLRELLTKRYGVRVVSIKTDGLSAKAIVAKIKEAA